MKYAEIQETDIVSPGEYLLHEPTQQIVLCGSVMLESKTIKALGQTGMLVDSFENYKKIRMSREERAEAQKSTCKVCGG